MFHFQALSVLLRLKQAHLYKFMAGDLSRADADEADRRPIPELLQQPAGFLVDDGGGISGKLEQTLVGEGAESPVLQLHADLAAQYLIGPQPGSHRL